MAKVTQLDAARAAKSKKAGPLERLEQLTIPTQEPELGTKDWIVWFVRKHSDTLVRPMGEDRLGANDATIWARLLADAWHLGWHHDDLYGIASRSDPIFQPIELAGTVTQIANLLRWIGVTMEKSVTRARDVETALCMILPRPSDSDWLAWDRDNWNQHRGIPFTNGVLDLSTLTLRPLNVDDRATWRIPYRWIGGQALPPSSVQFWLTHFQNLFGDAGEARLKTQSLLVRSAVALAPWIRGPQWQKALLLIGPGQNGKGTWIRLWQKILGPLMQSLAVAAYDDNNRFGLTNLRPDTLVAATPDMDENVKLRGTERWKKLTGDDPMDWERKNRDIITTRFQARIWMAGPAVPKVSDRSHGMYRRLRDTIIMFDRKQPEDPDYEVQMQADENIEAVLVLALTALHRVVTGQTPMPVPASAGEALEEYRRLIEPWEQWVDPDGGWLELDPDGWVASDRLWQVYQHWYQDFTGERYPKYMPRNKFGGVFTQHLGPLCKRGADARRGYKGVRILAEMDRIFED